MGRNARAKSGGVSRLTGRAGEATPASALSFLRMTLELLAQTLEQLGCPRDKSAEMAVQLDKRARQLSEEKNRPYSETLTHLLGLMRQGWAAQGPKP